VNEAPRSFLHEPTAHAHGTGNQHHVFDERGVHHAVFFIVITSFVNETG
jgi:hypothetical protein